MPPHSEQITIFFSKNKDTLDLEHNKKVAIINAGFMIDGVIYHINRIESLYDPNNLSFSTAHNIKHEFHALANRVGQFVSYLKAKPKIKHIDGLLEKYYFARNNYTAHRAADLHDETKQKPEYPLPEFTVGYGGEMRQGSKIIFQFIINMSKTKYFDLEPTKDGDDLIDEMKKTLENKIKMICNIDFDFEKDSKLTDM